MNASKATALTDAELLATILRNMDIQQRHPFVSQVSTRARVQNRPLFAEAARRNLQGRVS